MRLNEIVEELNAEFSNPEFMSEKLLSWQLITSLLKLAVIHIIRAFIKLPREKSKLEPKNASEELCYQVMNYIDTHIYTIKNLSELTEVIGYNYSYISSLFKKTTSQTLSEYFTQKRMGNRKNSLDRGKYDSCACFRTARLLIGVRLQQGFLRVFQNFTGKNEEKHKKNDALTLDVVFPFHLSLTLCQTTFIYFPGASSIF